jgi:hypothetical protein
MARAAIAKGQFTPSHRCDVERVLSLPLQHLQGEAFFESNLIWCEVRFQHHPSQERKKLFRVFHGAAETQQQPIFLSIAAQPCATPFHNIGEFLGVVGAAATAQK